LKWVLLWLWRGLIFSRSLARSYPHRCAALSLTIVLPCASPSRQNPRILWPSCHPRLCYSRHSWCCYKCDLPVLPQHKYRTKSRS
jgi:hypothetical protein